MFLADSEIDSSTSTLPGPRQFAVPSRFDIAQRQQEKKSRDEPGFGVVETVEKSISIEPERSRKKKKKHSKHDPGTKDTKSSSESEEESSSTSSSESDSDGDSDMPEELGIKLISTPPGIDSDKEKVKFAVVQPRSATESSLETFIPRRRPKPVFESINDDRLEGPAAIVEISQSEPILTVSRECYEEVS